MEKLRNEKKNLSYKNTYYNLVTLEHLQEVKKIVKSQGYYDSKTINNIQYCKLDGLPHYFLNVDSSDYTFGHYAMLDGIYLDVKSIIPNWHGKFYLGIVIIREPTNKKIKQFIAPAEDIRHELHHLSSLIDYIDNYPDYIKESKKYNAGSCAICDLDKSIKFEIKKIFSMEAPTLILDFNMGQHDILTYDNGTVTKITVHEKDAFLQYKVGQYIAELNGRYAKRFPENAEQIKNNLTKEVNRQGKMLFGDNCMMLLLVSLVRKFSLLESKGGKL